MTLQAIEGFDHMGSTTLMNSKNWAFTVGGSDPTWSTGFTAGRIVGNCFYMQSPTNQTYFGRLMKDLAATYDHFVCGFGFQATQFPDTGSRAPIFAFTTEAGTDVVRLYVTQSGRIQVCDGSGTEVAQSGMGVWTPNAWHFIETKIVINGASSTCQLYLNGVEVIATATVNFGATPIAQLGPYSEANNGWSTVHNGNVAVILYYDDLYFLTTTASPNNDFLGDCHVETIFPSADGSHSDWTPDTGLVHYSRVNERTGTYPDGDTSYVVTNAVNNQDTWQYDDLSITSGTVFGLQTNLYARKEDANLRQLVPLIVRSATTYAGTTVQTLASGYVDSTEIFEVDPSTSLAWTVTAVNAAEFGAKVKT